MKVDNRIELNTHRSKMLSNYLEIKYKIGQEEHEQKKL